MDNAKRPVRKLARVKTWINQKQPTVNKHAVERIEATHNRPSLRRQRRQLLLAIAVLLALLVIATGAWLHSSGRWPFDPSLGPPPQVAAAPDALGQPVLYVSGASALAVLEVLPVKGRAPGTGYQRSNFGEAWLDADANGCDTRNDILRRDLKAGQSETSSPCTQSQGTLADPYTGRDIVFKRGSDTSAGVQIDHVVALGNAWQTGAQQLSELQRQSLANDPLNLLAVDGPANQEKSASDAATWLPPNKKFRCHYVARQISVKAAYKLWVTSAEKGAMQRILAACPHEKALSSGYRK